jgi:ribosomal protein L37AE/L43A
MRAKTITNYVVDRAVELYLQPKATWVDVKKTLDAEDRSHALNLLKMSCYSSRKLYIEDGYSRCPVCKVVHPKRTKRKIAKCSNPDCVNTKLPHERRRAIDKQFQATIFRMMTTQW